MTGVARQTERETDDRLMRRVQDDEVDAFACLYDRHSARAFRVAFAVCRDATRAEDAVQDGFLAIWQCRETYQSAAGSFVGWAMMIVRHRAIDANRRAAARPSRGAAAKDVPDTATDSPPDAAVARESAEALVASLSRLPDAQAQVIGLAYFGQLSHTEIARMLDLPAGTVKGRMRLGLQKLREELADDDVSLPAATRAGR